MDEKIIEVVAKELQLQPHAVKAVAELLQEGSTIPFIARYRKEKTGNLDEAQIRSIDERRTYLHELFERKTTILKTISEQGKLTPELEQRITACLSKSELEDLYLPYKPKRKTRASAARERGLEPLALRFLAQPLDGNVEDEAKTFIREDVPTLEDALRGARDIVAEIVAEHADIRALVRNVFSNQGELVVEPVPDKTQEPTKFEQYYNSKEAVKTMPSHRFLAIKRGEREGILRASIVVASEPLLETIAPIMQINHASPFAEQLQKAIADSYERLLVPSIEAEVRLELKARSDLQAVEVFAENLRNLLLAAPLGERTVLAIDPGLRTGCKCAVLSSTGAFLFNTTFYIVQNDMQKTQEILLQLIKQYKPYAIAIGNGTAGRETETVVRKTLKEANLADIIVVQVNEAGASVYSASDVAREEFPELDVTVRGAISIGRRLQDPLAELVKIDPKAIGVGQYQHDVHQPMLQKKLSDVIESCVNGVGVELNTASSALLAQVAGIGPTLAKRIVQYRDKKGAFKNRQQLHEVSGFGPKAFEQAAGFLRIRESEHPLDSSAVHPERYALVERIAGDLNVDLRTLIGNEQLTDKIEMQKYLTDDVGRFTLQDILAELKKPGRDPRAHFEAPKFREDVFEINQLEVGMDFEGVVTNVTDFGAFVDIGVHQDGLVHISELSDQFVKDPHQVVKVGQKLKVRVLDVDVNRKRISLSAKTMANGVEHKAVHKEAPRKKPAEPQKQFSNNPFAKLLR